MAKQENQLELFTEKNERPENVQVESKSKNEVYSEASQYQTKVLTVDAFLESVSEAPIRIVCLNKDDKENVFVAEFDEDTEKSVVRSVRTELESDFDAVFSQSLKIDEMNFDVQHNLKAHETLLDKVAAKKQKSEIDEELKSAMDEANEEEYTGSKLDDASKRRFRR